jgi:hypothetical protein
MVTTRGGLETNADLTAGGRLRIRLKGNGSVWGASLDGFGPQLRTVRILDSPALIHQEPPWIRPARAAAARGSDGRGAGVLVHDGDAADCHYGAHVDVEHACPPAADDECVFSELINVWAVINYYINKMEFNMKTLNELLYGDDRTEQIVYIIKQSLYLYLRY